MAHSYITGTTEFKEDQYFRQAWLWAVLLLSAFGIILLAVVLDFNDLKAGKPDIWISLTIVVGTQVLYNFFFYITRLETRITSNGIYYRWAPFFRKYTFIPWAEIQEVGIRKYTNMKLGYHKASGYGKVHNVDGNKGVQLVLHNGRMVFIGSQRIPAIESTIGKFRKLSVQMSEYDN